MTASSTDQPIEPGGAPSLIDETARAVTGYYGRLGRIGLDLVRALLPVEGVRLDLTPLLRLFGRAGDGTGPATSPPEATSDAAGSRTLLVEGDGGRPGFGVFLVENLTAEPVSAPITVSAFVDEAGREVRPRLLLRPATVSLEPGQQAMVQLAADLDDALEPGVRYRGEIAIPALSDRRIPVVLHRVAAPREQPAPPGTDARASTGTDGTVSPDAEATASAGADANASQVATAAVAATPIAATALAVTMPRQPRATRASEAAKGSGGVAATPSAVPGTTGAVNGSAAVDESDVATETPVAGTAEAATSAARSRRRRAAKEPAPAPTTAPRRRARARATPPP